MSKYKPLKHYKLAYQWFLALDEGQNADFLAKILDVNKKTIRNWRKALEFGEMPNHERDLFRAVDPKVLDLAEKYIDGGMSFQDISQTLHIGEDTLRKYFPGRAWTHKQIVEHSMAVRKFNKVMRRIT